jgi:hypothetical protein
MDDALNGVPETVRLAMRLTWLANALAVPLALSICAVMTNTICTVSTDHCIVPSPMVWGV